MEDNLGDQSPQESTTQNQENSQKSSPPREEVRQERDFLKWKQEARRLQEENETLRKGQAEAEKNALIAKENYKEAWEKERGERVQIEAKLADTKNAFFNGLKQQEIKAQAMKLGIRDEAINDLQYLDTSAVEVETTSHGNTNILGAREFVENAKKLRPYWFKETRNTNVNNSNPGVQEGTKLDGQGLLKLQRENPGEYYRVMQERGFKR